MRRETTLPTRTIGLRAWLVAGAAASLLVMSGLAAASASATGTVWLCKPGLANNPCLSSEEATVELGNGSSFVDHAKPASNPPIDCFYVYPTVSGQRTPNANLNIEPEETASAVAQASRFSQVCKVYAPVYPQVTLAAVFGEIVSTPEAGEIAYAGVLSAWQEYLAKYNHGRGVVLIGHSQGAGILAQLIQEQIDPKPALRRQLVSAVLPGADLTVPLGGTVGGSFQHIPTCQVAWQTHCVVAYEAFLHEPPLGSFFGRAESPGLQVMCVNPTLLLQGKHAGPLLSYYPTSPFPGPLGAFIQVPPASTPWVATPGEYSGQCEQANGASWLQASHVGPASDPRLVLEETLGPEWGLHLDDVNIALGNLVGLVWLQSAAY
ncbi:MAG TPA: DUF3089 domain-containing protein [Solirubrobacteraceae bacterium]|jgi:hypothetical protein|nr:DUF3089 domain-containing protein [Solirubrobacteraceae bacterium]